MITGNAIIQDVALPKTDQGEVRHRCLCFGFDKEVPTLSPCLPNTHIFSVSIYRFIVEILPRSD